MKKKTTIKIIIAKKSGIKTAIVIYQEIKRITKDKNMFPMIPKKSIIIIITIITTKKL